MSQYAYYLHHQIYTHVAIGRKTAITCTPAPTCTTAVSAAAACRRLHALVWALGAHRPAVHHHSHVCIPGKGHHRPAGQRGQGQRAHAVLLCDHVCSQLARSLVGKDAVCVCHDTGVHGFQQQVSGPMMGQGWGVAWGFGCRSAVGGVHGARRALLATLGCVLDLPAVSCCVHLSCHPHHLLSSMHGTQWDVV